MSLGKSKFLDGIAGVQEWGLSFNVSKDKKVIPRDHYVSIYCAQSVMRGTSRFNSFIRYAHIGMCLLCSTAPVFFLRYPC